jgi:hypothetical protein
LLNGRRKKIPIELHACLVHQGELVTNPIGIAVTYRGAMDCTSALSFEREFGDGNRAVGSPTTRHAYLRTETYHWNVLVTAAGAHTTNSGTIVISDTLPGDFHSLPFRSAADLRLGLIRFDEEREAF